MPSSVPVSPPPFAPAQDSAESIVISVVIPCLNEERTVARCVREAWEGIQASGLAGEVIVADNGSKDRSRERAAEAGARIVPVPSRGYGAALQAGFLAARGELLVMGDADMSYDFRHIPRFAEEQIRTGADLVVGNRFRGGIQPGAMPLSHRLLGNPLLSWTIRRFFGPPLGDCYCGLRLITREAHRRLRLNATGMEYALQMIVQASLAKMKMAEVPTVLRVDGRDVPPHLKTFRDGYRSFRFLFQHGPISLYLLPGCGLAAAGGASLLWMAGREWFSRAPAPPLALALGVCALMIGWLMLMFGVVARVFAAGYLDSPVDPFLRRFFARFQLEHGVALSAIALLGGFAALAWGPGRSPALALLGVCALVLSVGTFLGSFVVSLMGRAVPDRRFYLPDGDAPPAAPRQKKTSYRDMIAPAQKQSGQNDDYSLRTQRALAGAPNYNRWLAETLAPAYQNAHRILDVGCSLGNVTQCVADCALARRRSGGLGGPEASSEGREKQSGMALGGAEIQVAGLEIIPEAAEEFRRRHAARPELKAVAGDLFNPPAGLLGIAPFDAAVSFNVLEHFEDDIEALRRIGALLRPGGRLGLYVPGGGERLYGTLDALDRHYRRYTPARLASRLEEAGFEVLRIRRVNFIGYFLWFFQGRVRKAKGFDEGAVARLDRLIPVFRATDAFLGALAGRRQGPPAGQSLAAIAKWNGPAPAA